MRYATVALAAALLCSGAAFAANSGPSDGVSAIGQYRRSNLQNASDTRTTGNDTSTDAKARAQVDSNGCQVSPGGREMKGSNAANTPDMNSQIGAQDETNTQTANNATEGGTKCAGKYPQAAPPVTQPGPK